MSEKQDKDYQQLKAVSTATLLEESTHVRLIFKAILMVGIFLVALLVWASIITVKETAVTYGEIVPQGQVQVVQHLEGGIVTDVLVGNGAKVKKGQILIKIDPTSVRSELSQLRSREINLILDFERLGAYVNGQTADFLKWSDKVIKSKYNSVKNKVEIAKLLNEEKMLLRSQNKKREEQQLILRTQLAQRKEQLKQAKEQVQVWKKHIELLSKEFNMYEELRKKNLVSHKDYLVVLREMNRAKGEHARLTSEIEQNQQAIKEAQTKLGELDSDLREKAQVEMGNVHANLLEVRHKIEKLEAQLVRSDVRAPVTGLVKGLKVSAGNVVQPGGLLLEIVPFDRELVVESRVNPRDVGHIKVGDKVDVKVLTYDFARYGSIHGILTALSASTFLDEKGVPYYKATIQLSKQYVGSGEKKRSLLPGMTVEASVITGEKTLLQYLLKPIHRSTSSAFSER